MGAKIVQSKARIKVGTYVGDGNAIRAITGIGFQADFVLIMPGSYYAQCEVLAKTIDMGGMAQRITAPGWIANAIISINVDGFTVSNNAGLPYLLNTLSETYYYLVLKN